MNNGKTLLTERLNTVLEYTDKSITKGALGHLAGIGAEFNKGTRNGRRYPVELWRNVMKSEDFKEGMDTHTLFAETDHPTDRIDTSIKEVCAVLTNMEIREDEGILWVEFDILDTPQGRILKSLVDYGCKIGVSSRGLGDEIQRNGETIIDPDTYSYYGHDMVVQPAVKSARPDKVESVARAKVTDIFKKEIENATSNSELVGLRRLAESVNVPDLDSITESINNKLSNGSLDGNNISEQLENDLGKLAEENEDLKTQLESLKKANNISVRKNRKITETYQTEAITARRTLRRLEVKNDRLVRENNSIIEELNREKIQLRRTERTQSRQMESLKIELDDAQNEIARLRESLRAKTRSLKLAETKLAKLQDSYDSLKESYDIEKDRMVELENEISTKSDELDTLYEENSSLTSDLERASTRTSITETKMQDVSNKLTEQGNHLTEVMNKYLEAKCMSEGLDKKLVESKLSGDYSIQNIDMVVEKLSDEKRRFNKLPISMTPLTVQLENRNGLDSEDEQTMRFLKGFTP